MISQFAVQLCANVLCRAAFGAAYDGHDSHGDNDREEPRHDPVNDIVQLLIRRLTAV
jgi:hypothetical protein